MPHSSDRWLMAGTAGSKRFLLHCCRQTSRDNTIGRLVAGNLLYRLEPDASGEEIMKVQGQKGKVGYIILWLLGVPISVLLLIALLRSC
jgi:hypothetical protein